MSESTPPEVTTDPPASMAPEPPPAGAPDIDVDDVPSN